MEGGESGVSEVSFGRGGSSKWKLAASIEMPRSTQSEFLLCKKAKTECKATGERFP